MMDVVPLDEQADVLELMLPFMHHTQLPDLSDLSIDLLSRLAEAAEKYGIYSAMSTCNAVMQ
jgi:hypothetical protein